MSQPHEVRIWDLSRISYERKRLEFPDLVRFRGMWYCAFREADLHTATPTSRIRLLRSTDGRDWRTVRLFEHAGIDNRAAKFAVTAEGHLSLNSHLRFGMMQTRDDAIETGYVPREVKNEVDYTKPVFVPGEHNGWNLQPNETAGVDRVSVAWLSTDGETWSSAHTCDSSVNAYRWSVTWHNGMGYSAMRTMKGSANGHLMRTRDGRTWRILTRDLMPDGARFNEACLTFDDDHTAYCLQRCHPQFAILGRASAPHYQDWQWRPLQLKTRDGQICPAAEKHGVQMGGPKLLRLADGRFIAAGRTDAGGVRDEITEAGGPARISVYHLDVDNAVLNELAEFDANSYPGAAEHDGKLYLTYGKRNASEIWFTAMEVPPS